MDNAFKKILFLSVIAVIVAGLPSFVLAENEDARKKSDVQKEQLEQDPAKRVLVKIGDIEITELEFNINLRAAIARMPAGRGSAFENPHGRRQFLNMMADQKVWVNGALEMGLDKNEEVMLQTRMSRDQILIYRYYDRAIIEKCQPGESEARLFYDANQERFLGPATIRVRQMVLPDSVTAERVLKELDSGANFAKLAREKSVDSVTAVNGGDLGKLTQGVALPASVGASQEYAGVLFSLKKGEISPVVRTALGYHIAKIEERAEPELAPFEEVKERIEEGLVSECTRTLKSELFGLLQARYPIEFMIEDSSVAPVGGEVAMPPTVANSPEALFQAAMDSKDGNQKIDIYSELVRKFPDSKYASQAQFMMGFVYSEELKDYEKAEQTFQVMLKKYPDSELADSARWMLDNMRDASKKVGSVEDVKKKAKEASKSTEP